MCAKDKNCFDQSPQVLTLIYQTRPLSYYNEEDAAGLESPELSKFSHLKRWNSPCTIKKKKKFFIGDDINSCASKYPSQLAVDGKFCVFEAFFIQS